MVASHELRAEGIRSQLGQTPDSLAREVPNSKFQVPSFQSIGKSELGFAAIGFWDLELGTFQSAN